MGSRYGFECEGCILHNPEVSHWKNMYNSSGERNMGRTERQRAGTAKEPRSIVLTLLPHRFAPLLQHSATTADPSRVIVTGSVAGIGVGSLADSGAYSYAASKAAVLHLVRNLAVELGPRNILVNGIAPGFFPSKMANVLMERSGGVEKLNRANPNGRLGKPEDIAATVVFLSSRAGGHVNGDTIVLDGGKLLGSARLERL